MTTALSDAERAQLLEKFPLGRLSPPTHIARAVVYLAPSRAAYITGATLHVNGAMYMGCNPP